MSILTRDKTTLVVFWTLCQRANHGATRYAKTKKATEFDADTDPDKAVESIYDTYGRVTDVTPLGRPTLSHAKVASHAIIHPHERGEIEAWTATEEPLFDAATMEACVSFKKQAKGPF